MEQHLLSKFMYFSPKTIVVILLTIMLAWVIVHQHNRITKAEAIIGKIWEHSQVMQIINQANSHKINELEEKLLSREKRSLADYAVNDK